MSAKDFDAGAGSTVSAKGVMLRQRWLALAKPAGYKARELARLCGVCQRQLERQFQRFVGRSPQLWLDEQRIREVEQLLLAGQLSKEIVVELGFGHPAHLCHQFKAFKQMTVSEFLALKRSGQDVAESQ